MDGNLERFLSEIDALRNAERRTLLEWYEAAARLRLGSSEMPDLADGETTLSRELQRSTWCLRTTLGDTLSATVVFLPSGRLSGLNTENEVEWQISAGSLLFADEAGRTTSHLSPERRKDGAIVEFRGPFIRVPGQFATYVLLRT